LITKLLLFHDHGFLQFRGVFGALGYKNFKIKLTEPNLTDKLVFFQKTYIGLVRFLSPIPEIFAALLAFFTFNL